MTIQSTGNSGLFWRALAISVAAHALLLSPRLPAPAMEPAAAALRATLRPFKAANPAPAATAPLAAAPRPLPATIGVSPAPTFAAPQSAAAVTRPASVSTPAAPQRSAVAGATEGNAPPTGATGAVSALAARAIESGGAGPDPDGLRQYRLALAREAKRFKRYPERARLEGAGGTAEVRVEHEAGRAPVTLLTRSSGHAALDDAALEMMRQAAPRAAVPASLSGRTFVVSLPVVFDLDE